MSSSWFAWRPVRLTVDGSLRWLCRVNRQRERLWGQSQFYYWADPAAYEPTELDWLIRAVLGAIILAGAVDVVVTLAGCAHLLNWGMYSWCPSP